MKMQESKQKKNALWRDIEARMEQHGSMPFNPFPMFRLKRLLSLVAPHFYTKEEIAQLEEIEKWCHQESPSKNEMEETKNGKKRCHSPTLEGRIKPIKKPRLDQSAKTKAKPIKKPRPSKPIQPNPPPTFQDLPIQFRNRIIELNGSDVQFVMLKKLFETDVKPNNNRLSMPLGEITCDFLTEREKATLVEEEDGRPVGLEVIVLDPCLREFTLSLKKWAMPTSSTYNLVKNWKLILLQNNLQVEQQFYIWSFRVNGKLYFILEKKDF